jgi:hypothetical protein
MDSIEKMTCPMTKDELREALSIAGEQRQRLYAWQIARFMDEIEQMVIRRSLWKNDPEKAKPGHRRTTPKPTRPWPMRAEHWPVFFFPLTLDEAKEICKYSDRGREVRRKIQKLFKRYQREGAAE